MYKVTTTNGEVYTANTVNEEGSFVVFKDGGKEIWLPIYSVSKIESTSNAGAIIGGLIVLALTGGALGW